MPRESLRVPAIGDVDGDRDAEIVATAGEHVYVWELDGTRARRFGADRALSEPCKPGIPKPCFNRADRAITSENHIKRGFISSAVLAQLDPATPGLEIVAGGLDQHVYAWRGDGTSLPGFPKKLATDGADGAEIVTTPAIADLDGAGPPEIVIATNEVAAGDPEFPGSLFDFLSVILSAATGYSPVYALHADGSLVDGWPVKVGVAAGDLLPLVLPGHDAAVIDADGGTDEVAVSGGTGVVPGGGSRLVDGDGATVSSFESAAGNRIDQTAAVLNLADYASAGDVLGTGVPQILKGGLSVNGVVNLLAVNQNLPYNHLEQLWAPAVPGGGYVDPGPSAPRLPAGDRRLPARLPGGRRARRQRSGPAAARRWSAPACTSCTRTARPASSLPAGRSSPAAGRRRPRRSVTPTATATSTSPSSPARAGASCGTPDVDACADSNDEWWTYHHDEHSTANYDHDARPPGTPRELTVTREGDELVVSSWRRATTGCAGHPRRCSSTAWSATSRPSFRLPRSTDSVTVRFRDEAGNWGLAKTVTVPAPGRRRRPRPRPTPTAVRHHDRHRPALRRPRGATVSPTADRHADPATSRRPLRQRHPRHRRRRDAHAARAARTASSAAAATTACFGEQGADCLAGGARPRLPPRRRRPRHAEGRSRQRPALGSRRQAWQTRDRVDCGPGRDVAIVDRRDRVRRCEKVRRR